MNHHHMSHYHDYSSRNALRIVCTALSSPHGYTHP